VAQAVERDTIVDEAEARLDARKLKRLHLPPRYPRVTLYNPRHVRATVLFSGTPYIVDPRSEFDVRGHYEPTRDEDGNILETRATLKVAAQEVAEFICADDQYGGDGFCILSGLSPEQKQAAKKKADDHWDALWIGRVNDEIEGWETFVRAVREAGGQIPKRPKRLDQLYGFRRSMKIETRRAFVCPVCAEEVDTQELLAAHIEDEHPDTGVSEALDIVAKSVDEKPKILVPKPKPDVVPAPARGSEQQLKGRALFDEAAKAKLPMTVADRKGLQAGDPDVMRDIQARLKRTDKK
jgi:hypothetical protein